VALLLQWEIVIARIPNVDGTPPPYAHPCIYLGESQKFQGRIILLGITSDQSQRIRDYSIDLPWSINGQAETGLTRPSIAQSHWIDHLMPEEAKKVIGIIPRQKQLEIIRAINLRHHRESKRTNGS
jgi:hypothetical protein